MIETRNIVILSMVLLGSWFGPPAREAAAGQDPRHIATSCNDELACSTGYLEASADADILVGIDVRGPNAVERPIWTLYRVLESGIETPICSGEVTVDEPDRTFLCRTDGDGRVFLDVQSSDGIRRNFALTLSLQ